MEVVIAAAKTHKYSVSESGDSLEVTDRPKGGISLILADGQGSGRSARLNSCMVTASCASMISEGARDGAAARAVHDVLYARRDGKVSAELLIVSVDLAANTLLVSRNISCPVLVLRHGQVTALPGEAGPIGVRRQTKPLIDSLPLASGLTVVGFSDGIWQAGRYTGQPWGQAELGMLMQENPTDPRALADSILSHALSRDQGRARDDMSVFALTIRERRTEGKIRTLDISLPI
ncbi:MAG: PP2C family protein-serine/threonine phosphatase [Bacillota bacterium]|jgi:serine phosphatase RsbU (regulator of sigma subunit)